MQDIEEWLEEWTDANLNTPQYNEDPSHMAEEAAACRADAKRAEISSEDLEEAAGGDLNKYLLDRQNAFTDSEVSRKAADD